MSGIGPRWSGSVAARVAARDGERVLLPREELTMRYPVDYIRHAAREIRKLEGRMRLGEGAPKVDELPALFEIRSEDELPELLKTLAKAFDEMAQAIEGLQRSRE
jgi:hypothetical protein